MEMRFVKNKDEVDEKIKEAMEALEAKENATYSQEYYDMIEKHRAALTDINERGAGCPWEWSFGFDYLVEFIKSMRDYYERGENVWAIEYRDEDPKKYKNVPTRLETLNQTLDYYEKWISAEERYIRVVEHPETYKSQDNGDGTVTILDHGFHCEYLCGKKFKTGRKAMKRCYKDLRKEQKKYKHLFFKMLEDHMEEWWD